MAKSKQPHDYFCIDAPYWCKPGSDDGDNDDEDDDEDDEDPPTSAADNSNNTGKSKQRDAANDEPETESWHLKSASDHLSYKWTMMWKTWTLLIEYIRLGRYTDPDAFGMYIHNDFHWFVTGYCHTNRLPLTPCQVWAG